MRVKSGVGGYCTPTPKSGGYAYPHVITMWLFIKSIYFILMNRVHSTPMLLHFVGTGNFVLRGFCVRGPMIFPSSLDLHETRKERKDVRSYEEARGSYYMQVSPRYAISAC